MPLRKFVAFYCDWEGCADYLSVWLKDGPAAAIDAGHQADWFIAGFGALNNLTDVTKCYCPKHKGRVN